MNKYLAVDIGASSGRHIVGWEEEGELRTEEVFRFPNGVTERDGHLTWDIFALLDYVKEGIRLAKEKHPEIVSLSVDKRGGGGSALLRLPGRADGAGDSPGA